MSTEYTRPPGKTTIDPQVLLTIARLTALQVPGVSHMSQVPMDIRRLLQRGHNEDGVCVEVINQTVNIDLYLGMEPNTNLRLISQRIQQDVSRAISEMVGMEAGRINIHIEDIYYPPQEEQT
jgi:uncharacterized alkaline shock family protein YloU